MQIKTMYMDVDDYAVLEGAALVGKSSLGPF